MKRLCPSGTSQRVDEVGDGERVASPLPQLVATVDEYLPYVALCEEVRQCVGCGVEWECLVVVVCCSL